MSIFDDNNYIEITKDDINDASLSSNHLEESIKKRAFANVLGARLGIKFLKQLDINASNFSSIYTIPAVLKDMDVSDIYTENNIKADIRIVADENHLFIPKAQFIFNITPDIYIFMKLSADFSTAEYIGAIAPDDMDKSVENSDYYFISKDTLYNEKSLKSALSKGKPQSNIQINDSDIVKAESMLVNFIDNDILNNEKHYVYEILTKSPELRQFFKNFEQFELISADLAHTEEILSDSVLDVLGAQEIYKNDLSEGDFASDINLDEIADATAADFAEEFIYENDEDENMPDNEDIIEGEFTELPEDAQVEEAGVLEALPSDEELANLAVNDNLYNENEIELEEIEPIEAIYEIEGFEGFEGLEAENNEISFEDFDLAINNATDISTEQEFEMSIDEQVSDIEPATELNNDVSLEINDIPEEPTDLNSIEHLDISTFETVEELQPLENFEEEQNIDLLSIEDTNEFIEPENEEILNEDNSITFDAVMENSDSDFSIDMEGTASDEFTLEEESLNEIDLSEFNTDDLSDVNEIDDITEIQEVDALETFEQPIDMTLSELEADENLPELQTVEDIQEEQELSNFDEIQTEDISSVDIDNLTLGDIAQDVNFDDVNSNTVEAQDLPMLEQLEPLAPLDGLTNTDNFENQEISQNDLEEEETSLRNDTAQDNIQNTREMSIQQEIILPEAETPNNEEDDDFSGLEEFTMDMAAAVEESNPHVHNPQLPRENTPAPQSFNETNLDIQGTIDNITAETAQINENFGLETFEAEQEIAMETFVPEQTNEVTMETYSPEQTADIQMETYNPNAVGGMEMETYSPETSDNSMYDNAFDTEGFTSDSQQGEGSELGSVNLDDLDDFDETDDFGLDNDTGNIDSIDSEFDNLNTDDIDISDINLDDIDLNDPNLNIDNIDLNEFDVDDMSSIENIPDITEQNVNYEMPQEDYSQYNPETGMPQNEEYVPDFNQNDQSTIEALYEGNPQNQNPGEAMDQSFNNNNVNESYQVPPQPQKKKTSPLLGILLIVLICAFGYMKKDLIMEKFNANKGVTVAQDQNMPIEGETQEDKEDAELLNDNTPPEGENPDAANQGIGDIPGEAGGPQDAASMEASLHQAGSQANTPPAANTYAKTPEPLASSEIKRLYWEIPQELTYNEAVVNYLKTVGKAMKFAIQSDLLNISEMPYSSKMIVDVVIKKDGSYDNVVTTVSSGSKQIDAIVLQSVKAALKYVKAPTSEFKNDSYNFSLIINF